MAVSLMSAPVLPGYNAIGDSRVMKIPRAAVPWKNLIRALHLH